MSRSTFRVSGKPFELASDKGWKFTVRPGGWILAELPSGERRRFAVSETKGKFSASVGGRLLHGDVLSRERGGDTGPSPDSDLSAQFPGKVRKVLVADGAVVKAGEPLLLVEAMKMEFAIKAPGAGRVKKVLVKEGQQLSPGDRFVDFEAADG
jgi:biotin carboxyl carrier protein